MLVAKEVTILNIKKTVSSAALGGIIAAGGLLLGATPSQAAVCGFYGEDDYNFKAYYNHCGPTNIIIQVDYTYANQERCVTPGITDLYANPALGAVINAFYAGRTC